MFDFDHLWQGALTLGALVLGWLHLGRNRELDAMRAESKRALDAALKIGRDLDAHKLYAAETFATTQEMKDEVRESERRIKEQIAQNHAHTLERLDDIRDRLPRRD